MAAGPPGEVRVFGIRHHGPGSARSLLAALEELQPDAVLIEGPPEGDEMLGFVRHAEMIPPVALLAYVPDAPHRAAFYPYAEFSPEWQALRFGLERNIVTRFIDLPQRHWLAMAKEEQAPDGAEPAAAEEPSNVPPAAVDERSLQSHDPLDALATAAGFADGERWWEYLVEERPRDVGGGEHEIFAAVMEMMRALRFSPDGQSLLPARWRNDPMEPVREASMRQAIRAAQREGFERIAVQQGSFGNAFMMRLKGSTIAPPALPNPPLQRA